MKIKEEVLKTIEALRREGFVPLDAVFEGALGVKEDATLAFMDNLNEAGLVSGVIRIIYATREEAIRLVEIPIGKPEEKK